ncbi:chemotaxis protein : CheW protein OS=Methylobacterium sp. GXF4 GN=WYO_4970 PE=4 SV=1: CheW: CheW [Gemmataceae bacterium]|nr:chemotaxis protein : CheW protein OS=Methylobacterium sp. GXF4 GN=WYO_4970 PE=4 SV=1: CheW: CheW [Gemmataceae bacterium]VTT97771.1 chemotaxis protein : CheW protein OS=Methylobacterium sp. GXF4 GN=WYO_4970 PE=4 SV=1: CheW: CheW [Gemmataceae bacterium]
MAQVATAKQARVSQCRVRDVPVALDLGAVRGVERADRMAAAPGDGDWPQVGSLPTRGGDAPVFSLAGLLGFPPIAAADGAHVLLCETPHGTAGVLVDQTAQGAAVGPEGFLAMPAVVGSPHFPAVVRTGGSLLPFLDPAALLGGAPPCEFPANVPWRVTASEAAQRRLVLVPVPMPARMPGDREWAVGLPAATVAELVEPERLVAVPGAPPHVAGVTAWRDRVVGVVNLAAWLGLPPTAPGRALVAVVAAPGGREPVGLLVPRGVRVLKLPVPNVASQRTFPGLADRVVSLVEAGDHTIALVDLAELTAAPGA